MRIREMRTSFGDGESVIDYDPAEVAPKSGLVRAVDGDDGRVARVVPLLD